MGIESNVELLFKGASFANGGVAPGGRILVPEGRRTEGGIALPEGAGAGADPSRRLFLQGVGGLGLLAAASFIPNVGGSAEAATPGNALRYVASDLHAALAHLEAGNADVVAGLCVDPFYSTASVGDELVKRASVSSRRLGERLQKTGIAFTGNEHDWSGHVMMLEETQQCLSTNSDYRQISLKVERDDAGHVRLNEVAPYDVHGQLATGVVQLGLNVKTGVLVIGRPGDSYAFTPKPGKSMMADILGTKGTTWAFNDPTHEFVTPELAKEMDMAILSYVVMCNRTSPVTFVQTGHPHCGLMYKNIGEDMPCAGKVPHLPDGPRGYGKTRYAQMERGQKGIGGAVAGLMAAEVGADFKFVRQTYKPRPFGKKK